MLICLIEVRSLTGPGGDWLLLGLIQRCKALQFDGLNPNPTDSNNDGVAAMLDGQKHLGNDVT